MPKLPATVLFPYPTFPTDSIKLGRLVQNPNHPHQDYLEPISIPWCQENVLTSSRTNLHLLLSRTKSSTLRLHFTSLLTRLFASTSHHSGNELELSSFLANTYILNNSGEWFQRIIQMQETQRWIEKAIKVGRSNIYFIVGYLAVQNLRVNSIDRKHYNDGGGSSTDAGSITSLRNALDGGGTLKISGSSAESISYTVPGEVICGVQYRKLKFRILSSKDQLDPTDVTLENGNRWKTSIYKERGKENVMDMIEAVLDDEDTDEQNMAPQIDMEGRSKRRGWERFEEQDIGGDFFVFQEYHKPRSQESEGDNSECQESEDDDLEIGDDEDDEFESEGEAKD